MSLAADLAGAQGVDLRWHNTVYLICVALTVALGVRIVGGLMTAARFGDTRVHSTARNVSQNLTHYASMSVAAGGLGGGLGILGYAATDMPPGPLIIFVSAVPFLGPVYVNLRRAQT